MVKKLLGFLGREIKGLHEAAYVLAVFALLSQVLGLVRDRLFASYFGAGEMLDVYYAAFRIPDFIFTIMIALVSSSVLVPYLIRIFETEPERSEMFRNSIFTGLLVLAGALSIGTFFLARPLLGVLFPAMMAGSYADTLVVMTQIMLLQPILLAVSGFFASYMQVFHKFFMYALSPLFYNIGIILGIVWLYPLFGLPGLAWGVVLGAGLHMLSQAIPVQTHGIVPRFIWCPDWRMIRDVFTLSLPRTIAVAGGQITSLVLVSLAGLMTAGSISIFTLAHNLQSVPMAIIGVSYSMAAFPTLARLFAQGDVDTFLGHITRAARHIIFWSVPVMVLFVVLRAQIVRTILGSGSFGWSETRLVAAALALFAISVVAQSLILLFVRGYYAMGETFRPVRYASVSIVITIIAAFGLYELYQASPYFVAVLEDLLRVSGETGTIVLVLPLAFSIGQISYALMLWFSFSRRFKCFTVALWKSIFHTVVASISMGIVAYVMLQVLDDVFDINTLLGIFSQGAIAGVAGIVAGILVLVVIKNEEVHTVGRTLHSKFWKKAEIVVVEVEEEL
jgi:putative peptidoglycan lipid II flippase